MKPVLGEILIVFMSSIDEEDRVKIFSKLPKKKDVLVKRMPEKIQFKIIQESFRNKANITYLSRHLQKKEYHYFISKYDYSSDVSSTNKEELYHHIKVIGFKKIAEVIVYIFESMSLLKIEEIFPTFKEIKELVGFMKKVSPESHTNQEINTENSSTDEDLKERIYELQKKGKILESELDKKNKIIENLKSKHFEKIEKMNVQHSKALKIVADNIQTKNSVTIEGLKKRNKVLLLELDKIRDSNRLLTDSKSESAQLIEEMQMDLKKKLILLIVDDQMNVNVRHDVRFIQIRASQGIEAITSQLKSTPINEIWVVREHVSSMFIHRIRESIVNKIVKEISIASLKNMGENYVN